MPLKILVLSASVGNGHIRAAQAVELALHHLEPTAFIQHVDVLGTANAAFRRIYTKTYLNMVQRTPHLVGYIYDRLDRPGQVPPCLSDRFRILIEKLNLRNLVRLIRDGSWNAVVHTHFLPAEIMASLRRNGRSRIPHFTVTTDFDTHRLWVNHPCDHYCTAAEEGAAHLRGWGVVANDISVTGIPIHPVFSQPKEREACLESQGLQGDRPIVLQVAGGGGSGPMEMVYRGLLAIALPLEIVVVAGRNENARKQLGNVSVPIRHRVKVQGFSDGMDELLAVADVVVSKPGGLTTSEALARGAVMAIVNPIPGQESRNSDYLLENGAAIKINNLAGLSQKIGALVRDSDRLGILKSNALRLSKPQAAFTVARQVLARLPA